MTIRNIVDQLHTIAVDGTFNGEHFSKSELNYYICNMFRPELNTRNLIMEITLLDGNWFFSINRYSDNPDGFDYTIPDNREQESRILALLS